ncbi:MAG: PEGA domain-containing protein [Deltaproteobacteria bacterium]|nr:PEGA domain-containing protein [Deltaproteobacteria bacterium]
MRFLLLVVCAVVLSARPALADDREEARKAFAAGQAADKSEDWQTAIEHYLRAYDLVPHHFALYNIGRDYERLGQLREAATWYQRYVEAAPPSGDRDKVQILLGELKVRPAKLTVKSTPSGAKVIIDGKKVGITPFTAPIRGGGHRVAVELDGERDERDVALEYGEPETVELTLKAVSLSRPLPQRNAPPSSAQGILVVRGDVPGALITINEMPAGTVPMSIPIAEGQHRVKVTSFGYTPYETTAYVTRGLESSLDVQMTKGGLGSDVAGPKIQIGYMIGTGAGVDLQGDGAIVLFDFGVRVGQGDAVIRVGKAIGLTAVDFLVRWAIFKTRLSPYIGGGYSYVASNDGAGSSSSGGGSGWEVVAGLRFDLTRGAGTTFSLIGEAGVRTYSGISTSSGGTDSGIFVPFMGSLQITFGRTR